MRVPVVLRFAVNVTKIADPAGGVKLADVTEAEDAFATAGLEASGAAANVTTTPDV